MNYVYTIIRILEIPKLKIFHDNRYNILMIKIRAELPNSYNTQIVNVTFWGNLAYDIYNDYIINDYIMISGYLSFIKMPMSQQIEITVLKMYPFILSSDYLIDEN